MYTKINSSSAKAQLSKLLQAVKQGQCYTIMVDGHPIADLVPSKNFIQLDAQAAVEAMQNMPKIRGVSIETLTEWVQAGRK
jgi:antitoxin (DNA-binding transcriptional repressor) of toxin-antitoxin stability system